MYGTGAPLIPGDPASIGSFTLLGRIGSGGMGQVYLGESPGGEPAAVKVIKPSVVDSEARRRFAQEIEVLKTIWGTRIAAFLDADPEAENPWLATEYVEGPDLRRHLAEQGTLPVALAASLGATLAEALAGVHKVGLLHRDLKPANILLGPNGPKIIDFGLAAFSESGSTLTAPNVVIGTPACMAPEQAAGERPLSPAVDVHGLGASLLYALTGHFPYAADHVQVLFHRITDPAVEPDLSGVPETLLPLLRSMLAHDRHDRPDLDGVVSACRTVIESHGLSVAQARRRLSNLTAAGTHTIPAPPPASGTGHRPLPPTLPLTRPYEAEPYEAGPGPAEPHRRTDSRPLSATGEHRAAGPDGPTGSNGPGTHPGRTSGNGTRPSPGTPGPSLRGEGGPAEADRPAPPRESGPDSLWDRLTSRPHGASPPGGGPVPGEGPGANARPTPGGSSADTRSVPAPDPRADGPSAAERSRAGRSGANGLPPADSGTAPDPRPGAAGPPAPAGTPGPGRPAATGHSSAAARRIAQQLRESYAQRAPF